MASGSGIETNHIRYYVGTSDNSFFPGACNDYRKIPSEDCRMLACSKCRLVWYCGKECQRNNWIHHRDFCKAVSFAIKLNGPGSHLLGKVKEAVRMGRKFENCLLELTAAVSLTLYQMTNRHVVFLETKIIYAAKICVICKDTNIASHMNCKICHLVFYCSEEHANEDKERHKTYCPEYNLSLQCYNLEVTKGLPIPGTMPFTIPTVRKYKPISGTMKDYVKPTFEPDIDACLSEWVCYPLSLLYALEHIGLNDGTIKISEVKELTVLMFDPFKGIFGTMVNCLTWEYMLHLLPKLKTLNIVLYDSDHGPAGFTYCNKIERPWFTSDVTLCSDCKSRKCKLILFVIKDYKCFKGSNVYKKPDVIYNHMITSGDEKVNLPYPEPKVPLVLIYNDIEDLMDQQLDVLRRKETIDILLPFHLNPFRGMRPYKTVTDYLKNGSGLHYRSCYIVGLRRKAKKRIRNNLLRL